MRRPAATAALVAAILLPASKGVTAGGPLSAPALTGCADVPPSGEDDPAIRRALAIIPQQINPVRVVGADTIRKFYARAVSAGAPPAGLNAFRAPADPADATIYVNGDALVYRDALGKPSALATLKLAATLVHEQVHNTDGDGAAYRLQADFVRSRLGTLPRPQRAPARQYLEGVDARARALARVGRSARRTAFATRQIVPERCAPSPSQ